MAEQVTKSIRGPISFVFSGEVKQDSLKIELTEQKPDRFIEFTSGNRKLLLAIGEHEKVTRRKLFLIARQVVASARSYKHETINIDFENFRFKHLKLRDSDLAELVAMNCELANFEFVDFKSNSENGVSFVKEIYVGSGESKSVQSGFRRGQVIGQEINNCRILANTPGGDMTPAILAQHAQATAKAVKVRSRILDKDDIKILKMGGVLGVARGSSEEPKFIILEYYGTDKKEKPVVLVGKGVTFDSGGLNIKPSDAMADMHHDMAGGAAAIHAVIAAARLGIKKNLVALVPAVENMLSGSSYHPGDVLRTMSGKTIEVLNTDAEGRIILADALTYAERYEPKLVIDIATLTGAAMVALGQRAAAVFTKDEKLSRLSTESGEETGDYLWPMPLWDEYESDIKGTFGDWANIGKTRYGGAITAAVFLHQFAKHYPWIHIDIAPTMTAIEGQYLAKGAAGTPIAMLIRLLEKL